MIKEFYEEKATYDDGKELILSSSPIGLNLNQIESVNPVGDDRCRVVMTTGREYILKTTYKQVFTLIEISNNERL
jgi:hypothetical protein